MLGLVVVAGSIALLTSMGNRTLKLLASGWLAEHEAVGALAMVPIEATWIVLGGPTTPVELLIGFVFGLPGLLINVVGKFLGCVASFVLGRTVLRGVARNKFMYREAPQDLAEQTAADGSRTPTHALFVAVEQLLAAGPRQIKMLLLIQLAWVPIAFKNYGLALMPAVTLPKFAVTSLVGELPSSVALVAAGMSARNVKDVLDGHASMTLPQVLAMALASASLVVLLLVVGLRLRSIMTQQPQPALPPERTVLELPSTGLKVRPTEHNPLHA